MTEILSTTNAHVKQVSQLVGKAKVRKSEQAFTVEGLRMVMETPAEMLRECYMTRAFFDANRQAADRFMDGHRDTQYFLVSDAVMKAMADTESPQGILAVVSMPSYCLKDLVTEDTFLLVLDHIQDPGNLGTMMRTAEGAGAGGILMSSDTVDLFNPKVVRATMGSLYRMPFVISEDLAGDIGQLKEAGVRFYAAHLEGRNTYDAENYCGPCGLMIGNEGNGLSDAIAALADIRIRIPMEGRLESLNAAMAAGVLMYEVHRQRTYAKINTKGQKK